jgi:hypothetical protein
MAKGEEEDEEKVKVEPKKGRRRMSRFLPVFS